MNRSVLDIAAHSEGNKVPVDSLPQDCFEIARIAVPNYRFSPYAELIMPAALTVEKPDTTEYIPLDEETITEGTVIQFDIKGFTNYSRTLINGRGKPSQLRPSVEQVSDLLTLAAQTAVYGQEIVAILNHSHNSIELVDALRKRYEDRGVIGLSTIELTRLLIEDTVNEINKTLPQDQKIEIIGSEGDMGRYLIKDQTKALLVAGGIEKILTTVLGKAKFDPDVDLSFRIGIHTIDANENESVQIYRDPGTKRIVSVGGVAISKVNQTEQNTEQGRIGFSANAFKVYQDVLLEKNISTDLSQTEHPVNVIDPESIRPGYEVLKDLKQERLTPSQRIVTYGKIVLPIDADPSLELPKLQHLIEESGLVFIKFNTILDGKVSFILTSSEQLPVTACLTGLEKLREKLVGYTGILSSSFGHSLLKNGTVKDMLAPCLNVAARGIGVGLVEGEMLIALDEESSEAAIREGLDFQDCELRPIEAKGINHPIVFRIFRNSEKIFNVNSSIEKLESIENDNHFADKMILFLQDELAKRNIDELAITKLIQALVNYSGFSYDNKDTGNYEIEQYEDFRMLATIVLGSARTIGDVKPSYAEIMKSLQLRVHQLKYAAKYLERLEPDELEALRRMSAISLGREFAFNYETALSGLGIDTVLLDSLREKGALTVITEGQDIGKLQIRPPFAKILDSSLTLEEIHDIHFNIVRTILPKSSDWNSARVVLLHAMYLHPDEIKTLSVDIPIRLNQETEKIIIETFKQYVFLSVYSIFTEQDIRNIVSSSVSTMLKNHVSSMFVLRTLENLEETLLSEDEEDSKWRNDMMKELGIQQVITLSEKRISDKIRIVRDVIRDLSQTIKPLTKQIKLIDVVEKGLAYAKANGNYLDLAILGPAYMNLLEVQFDDNTDNHDYAKFLDLKLHTGRALIAMEKYDTGIQLLTEIQAVEIPRKSEIYQAVKKMKAEAILFRSMGILTRNNIKQDVRENLLARLRRLSSQPLLSDHRLEILNFLKGYGVTKKEKIRANRILFNLKTN